VKSGVRQQASRAIKKMQGKKMVHLLHIRKTGGSAIKHALAPHLETSRYVIHLHSHGFRLRDVPEGDGVVFFVRDPISRFVSGFFSRQRQGQPRYFSPWTPDERIAFEHFSTPNELAAALFSSDEEMAALAEKAMKSIRHVKSSYWKWLESEEYLRYRIPDIFFIGFLERLSEDFQALKSKLGLPAGVVLPDDDVLAHRSPANLDKSLEDGAVENLRRWYKDDFRLVSMCRDIVRQQRIGTS
jgi:hypothetical protein